MKEKNNFNNISLKEDIFFSPYSPTPKKSKVNNFHRLTQTKTNNNQKVSQKNSSQNSTINERYYFSDIFTSEFDNDNLISKINNFTNRKIIYNNIKNSSLNFEKTLNNSYNLKKLLKTTKIPENLNKLGETKFKFDVLYFFLLKFKNFFKKINISKNKSLINSDRLKTSPVHNFFLNLK